MPDMLAPLKFRPIIKPLPWGGRRLQEQLGKNLPPGLPCGESWEVVDLQHEQSEVIEGPWQGKRLGELVQQRRDELLGEVQAAGGRFPLLFKFIDARETLSLQVHPDEEAAARLGGSAKSEAWYVLDAAAGAKLFLGLEFGATPDDLKKAIERGDDPKKLLRAVEAKAGEFFFVPAGMLHSIGGGVLLAEIQQASDTTFRVWDWGRLGLDGRPRPLHLEQAMAAIRHELSGKVPHAFPLSGRPGVRCRAFSIERARLDEGQHMPLDAGRPRLVSCIEGSGEITRGTDQPLLLAKGETCLVPACRAESVSSRQGGTFLLVRI